MKLSGPLVEKLRKKYPPSTLVDLKHRGKDLTMKTDAAGNAMVLFIGKMQSDGKIKGLRYVRTLIEDSNGFVIKDHWDLKGKS